VTEQKEGPLTGYRALDLADSKGALCAKLLADLGAEVIKIEKPEGDVSRNIPPFAGNESHPEKSLHFLFRNANKFGITLNLETSEGKTIFKRLVEKTDVLVEDFTPGYMKDLKLDYPSIKKINPGLIMASITDFGQSGPYRDWKGSPIVHFAMSANMIDSGFPGEPPVNIPGTPAYDAVSMTTAISIVLSLYDRGGTGKGHYIDTSVHETARLGLYPWKLMSYSYFGVSDANTNMDRLGPTVYPVYPCKDGFVRMVILTPWQWEALVKLLGDPEVLKLSEWSDLMYRVVYYNDLYILMSEFTMNYTMQELFEAGHEAGVPIVPVNDVEGFAKSPHTRARGFFIDMDHPEAGSFQYPGPPYRLSETPFSIRRPAPCLGEHNETVYCDELGFSKDELLALKRAKVV